MFGNSPFGFSGAGGGGGGTIGGGGTLNYLCKFTPDGLNIGNSMFFDNGISVGLGTITPDASAILDLTSTSQGFLAPRMTTIQRDAIITPVNALLIYNTTTLSFNYYNGLTWIDFGSTVVTSPFNTSTSTIEVGDNFQAVAEKTQGQINQIVASISNSNTFMFSSINSDVAGYESMPILSLFTPSVTASSSQVVTTTPTLIEEFITDLGYPNQTAIPSGIATVHYETEKVSGANNYYSYAEIYKRTSGGTETLLATTDSSSETSANIRVQVTVSVFLSTISYLNLTDRIVVKIYCVMLSSSATIGVYYDDNTGARLQLPTAQTNLIGVNKGSFGIQILKGQNVITTGLQEVVTTIPYSGTITGWQIYECSSTPVSSSIVIDVWSDAYGNYPPTIADTIWGGSKPTLTAATKAEATGLAIPVTAGNTFLFNVDSVTIARNIVLVIYVTKTS